MTPSPDDRNSLRPGGPLLAATLVLLAVAAGHILQLHELAIDVDEVWSVWQTFGSPVDIVRWTPYDWPPLYYLMVGLWQRLVGLHPEVLRMMSVLAFMLGAAAMYRVLRRWVGVRAGVIGMLAYGALEYSLFLSTEIRGYAVLLGLMPLALWLTVRYFDRPTLWRGIGLGIILAVLFYTSLSVAVAFLMLGMLTLVCYPRAIWRWWLPGVVGGLIAVPLLLDKFQVATGRGQATQALDVGPLFQALAGLFADFAGRYAPLWALALVGAIAGIVLTALRKRSLPRPALAILLWAVGGPLVMYLLNSRLGFFSPRYAWWIMLGLALTIGWGLSKLPVAVGWASAAVLAVLLFFPGPLNPYKIASPALQENLRWLAGHMAPQDVMVVDPNHDCGSPEMWDYLTRVYLPNGLPVVDDPDGYRRVWYVRFDGRESEGLERVMERRLPGIFVGPPQCLIRLYEGPPDPEGIPFANGMRFHGIEFPDDPPEPYLARREGEPVRVRLWWSVDEPPEADYSVGIHLLDGLGQLIAQDDSAPQVADAPPETSRWDTDRFYVETRTITLPYPIDRGSYTLYLVVYQWWDSTRIEAPGMDDHTMLPLRAIAVVAW